MKTKACLMVFGLLLSQTVSQDPIPNAGSSGKESECSRPTCNCCISQNCTTCNGKCKDGYFGGNCLNKCPDRCTVCDDYGAESSVYIGHGICTECKSGYYSTLEYFQCNYACPERCLTCKSPTECHSCKNGFYMEESAQALGECKACPEECETCISETKCTSCNITNFTGETCMECITGRYGEFCIETCPKNCLNDVCDRNSGICTDCKRNFKGPTCETCTKGKYGQSCDLDCSFLCQDSECRQEDGLCSNGCVGNFTGPKCEDCAAKKYGINCTKVCPKHCAGTTCDRDLGVCHDCQTHFYGPKCEDCVIGRHGSDCSLLCPPFCRLKICERQGGECLSCEGTKYGPFCNMSCSSNCNDTSCDKKGFCTMGCKEDYSGDRCCLYGKNCEECASNDTCSRCKLGKFGELCENDCPRNCEGRDCNKVDGTCQMTPDPVPVGAIVGATFGSTVVMIGITLFIIYLICRRNWQLQKRDKVSCYQKQANDPIENEPKNKINKTEEVVKSVDEASKLEMKQIESEPNIAASDSEYNEYMNMGDIYSTPDVESANDHAYESCNTDPNPKVTGLTGPQDHIYYGYD